MAEQTRIQNAINDFKEKYPNERPLVRIGSGRIILQSDKHKEEY